ncbi:MAG: tRNA pseudouridine(38-40) synthase TruA [Acidimicrobiales bacterium]|nr:tRNA pseudouridine(38-40) synthase TruA [Acidimicrobiales bacterium]
MRLTLAYHGTGFHGFAPNPGVRTVAGVLETALGKLLNRGLPVAITAAGRTDAGVHAWGQVVSFDAPAERVDPARLQRALNKMLAPEIVVRDAQIAPPDFDARFSARWRMYRYSVINRPIPDPFLADTAWWVAQPLDLHALWLACDPFIGEHDFTSFCRKPDVTLSGVGPSMVRRVYDARWEDEGDGLLRFWIKANSFCHQMVRSVVGTMVEAGLGKKHAGDITGILQARDRAAAGVVAPPQGLCLWEVGY